MKSGACPYCGGPYTIMQSCTGPRTDDPRENTCAAMQRHHGMVTAAIEEGDPEEAE